MKPKFSKEEIRYLYQWCGIKPVDMMSTELGRTVDQIKIVCDQEELSLEVLK